MKTLADKLELLQRVHVAIEANKASVDLDRFWQIADTDVFTVGQLAGLFGVHRQTIYQRYLRAQKKPGGIMRGKINGSGIEYLLEAVKAQIRGERIPPHILQKLPECGTPGLVELLTGVNYRAATNNDRLPYHVGLRNRSAKRGGRRG